jgi:hypothetical protein
MGRDMSLHTVMMDTSGGLIWVDESNLVRIDGKAKVIYDDSGNVTAIRQP